MSHGPTPVLGFIFDASMAYTPDVWEISEAVFERLSGIDTWVVDSLRYNTHPTHAHADQTFSWLARSCTKHGVLTNLHIDMDYQTLKSELPSMCNVAFDGMTISM